MTTHSRQVLAAAALLLGAGGAMAEGGVPPEVQMQLDRAEAAASTLTRAEVQAQVLQARQAGMLLAAGEIAEPDSVFVARERYNLAQAREIAERYARIEEENAARVRALALQLEPGRRVASVSNDAALQIITERADGSELTAGAPGRAGNARAPRRQRQRETAGRPSPQRRGTGGAGCGHHQRSPRLTASASSLRAARAGARTSAPRR